VNFELLIRQYLYQNKSISLPGIGRLAFAPDVQLPSGVSEKTETIPLQDLRFTYDLQQQADPEFVKFVSTHTGKIAPLASSDVDSHFMLSRQFINIGKAYIIDGVGTVEKKDDGTYGFTPGTYIPVSDAITTTHKPLKVREPLPVIPKNVTAVKKQQQQVNYRNIILILGLIVVLGAATWAVWYYMKNRSTTAALTPTADSISVNKDTPVNNFSTNNLQTGGAVSNDPNAYKAIFEVTRDKNRALSRTSKLKAYGTDARIETSDSITFKLWTPLNAAPSDTLRKRDSLSKFFAKKVRLEKL
jgi:hypothetical protein